MLYTGPMADSLAWVTVDDFCEKVDGYKAAQVARAIAAATDYLWRRTGCQYTGDLETTLRPSAPCGHDEGDCGCNWRKVRLKTPNDLPVISVDEVRVNGDIIPTTGYILSANRYLTHRDYSWPWWPYQDMNLDEGEQGTWAVDITYGQDVPSLGIIACVDLTEELLKAECKKDDCALPKGVTSVSRDGVTYNFEPISSGYTNIQTVDFFLNPTSPYIKTGWSGFGDPNSPTIIVET